VYPGTHTSWAVTSNVERVTGYRASASDREESASSIPQKINILLQLPFYSIAVFRLKLSRSRWHVEQYFQRSKDDLGLDHYEGRSWRGFYHHLVMSAVAYLFVLTIYLEAKNFWSDVGEDPRSDPALATEIDRTLSLLPRHVPGEN
jgi:hypothetical protein